VYICVSCIAADLARGSHSLGKLLPGDQLIAGDVGAFGLSLVEVVVPLLHGLQPVRACRTDSSRAACWASSPWRRLARRNW
jgi:hypothetical protein